VEQRSARVTRTEEILERFFSREGGKCSMVCGELWVAVKNNGCFMEVPGLVSPKSGGEPVAVNLSELARSLEEVTL
jgi:hypothetical protein